MTFQSDITSMSPSEEMCEIVSYETESCAYDCSEQKTMCDGYIYHYTAFAREKCGEDPLYISIADLQCPSTYYASNQTYACYVLSCADQEFSFKHSSDHLKTGIVLVSVCGFVAGFPCLCVALALCHIAVEECCGVALCGEFLN